VLENLNEMKSNAVETLKEEAQAELDEKDLNMTSAKLNTT